MNKDLPAIVETIMRQEGWAFPLSDYARLERDERIAFIEHTDRLRKDDCPLCRQPRRPGPYSGT